MGDTCPVVKVKPWGEGQGDYVEVNVSDFDPEKHEPIDAVESEKVKPARESAKGRRS